VNDAAAARSGSTSEPLPAGIEPVPSASDFRLGMRRLASGVSLITTVVDGVPHGLAATSVSSLSADPPTLLVCVNRTSSSHEPIAAAGRFCVNVLSESQQPIAARFGSALDRAERFSQGSWSVLQTGAPALDEALANFDCVIDQAIPYRSHTIFIGRIQAIRLSDPGSTPLLYLDGRYRSLTEV